MDDSGLNLKTPGKENSKITKKERLSFSLEKELTFFSAQTRANIEHVISTALRILRYRWIRKQRFYNKKLKEKRKKEKRTIYLKKADVSNVIVLADFHFSKSKEVQATAQMGLHSVSESDALRFYEKFVMGRCRDKFGREIEIDEEGIKFLYKEDETGQHTVKPEFYEEIRGKRLHWIRPTIEQSEEVYENHEKSWTSYYYIGTFIVPYTDVKTRTQMTVENYFFAVVRKEANKPFKFITAYPIYRYGNLLKYIEPARPYIHKGS